MCEKMNNKQLHKCIGILLLVILIVAIFHECIFGCLGTFCNYVQSVPHAIFPTCFVMAIVLLSVDYIYKVSHVGIVKNDVLQYKTSATPLLADEPCADDLMKRERYAKYLLDKIFQTFYVQNKDNENHTLHHRSFVIHLGEKYGKGKTSFLLLLKKYAAENANKVIWVEFQPWLCDKEDIIVKEFFKTLSNVLSEYLPSLKSDLQEYVNQHLKILSIKDHLMLDFKSLVSEKSLKQSHDEIRDELTKIDRPIIIAIDDVDRLQRLELMTVLKLIRNVADFPNVYYLVAADNVHLVNMLKALDVENPNEYLKKFFNLELQLPANEHVAEKYLLSELPKKYEQMGISAVEIAETLSRINKFKYLTFVFHDMREVYRFLNAYYMQLDFICSDDELQVNYFDLFCLTLLRVLAPDFYLLLRDNFQRILEGNVRYKNDSLFSLKKDFLPEHNHVQKEGKGPKTFVEYYNALTQEMQVCNDEVVVELLNEMFGREKQVGANNICRTNKFYNYFANDMASNVIGRLELAQIVTLPLSDYTRKVDEVFKSNKGNSMLHEFGFVYEMSNLSSSDFLLKFLAFLAASYPYSKNERPYKMVRSLAGFFTSDNTKVLLAPILEKLYDIRYVNYDRSNNEVFVAELSEFVEDCDVKYICPLMQCLHIMRQDTKSYLFKPQDLLKNYSKLINRFWKEEVEVCDDKLSDQVIDTFITIIETPFEEIKWHESFVDFLCNNEVVFSSFLKQQVDVYRNNEVEWNDRYAKVLFAALDYPTSSKMIHKLFTAQPKYQEILLDLAELYRNNHKSLLGVSLKNDVYYKFVIGG